MNYEDYLNAKLEPQYRVNGRTIIISRSPITTELNIQTINEDHLFDYQKFILNEAIKRQRYAIFADCGLGKTAMFLAWIKRITPALQGKKVLIISPLMVRLRVLMVEGEKKKVSVGGKGKTEVFLCRK